MGNLKRIHNGISLVVGQRPSMAAEVNVLSYVLKLLLPHTIITAAET
jgi:hypothetical protein